MKSIGQILISTALLVACQHSSQAETLPNSQQAEPSYRCATISPTEGSSVERLICADEELAKLDQRLNQMFQQALKTSDDPSQLKAFQQGWIKGRDDCWKQEDVQACAVSQYRHRITELEIANNTAPETIKYRCTDESLITVKFYERTEIPAAVLSRDTDGRVAHIVTRNTSSNSETPTEHPSADVKGQRYSGRNVDFWNRRDQASVNWGGTEINCSKR